MKNKHLNFFLILFLSFPILLFLNSCGGAEEDLVQPNMLEGTPPDIIADCDNIPSPPLVTQSDNGSTVGFSEVIIPGPCEDYYQIERTWSACNLSHTQIISVVDNRSPELLGIPADITISCNDPVPSPSNTGATDNCDNNVSIEFNETITNVNGCAQTIIRTWTATDNCGNTTQGTQTIVIN